jgi:hypothetical protein
LALGREQQNPYQGLPWPRFGDVLETLARAHGTRALPGGFDGWVCRSYAGGAVSYMAIFRCSRPHAAQAVMVRPCWICTQAKLSHCHSHSAFVLLPFQHTSPWRKCHGNERRPDLRMHERELRVRSARDARCRDRWREQQSPMLLRNGDDGARSLQSFEARIRIPQMEVIVFHSRLAGSVMIRASSVGMTEPRELASRVNPPSRTS